MITKKIFEQEKVPTMPHVLERMYNVDQELEEISKDDNKIEMAKNICVMSVLIVFMETYPGRKL